MVTVSAEERPKQNWVLSPIPDFLLIIAAPILGMLWAVAVYLAWGQAAVLGIFMVFNVGHHLPTWIRIYGDRQLLQRFRWSLLLGPVIPFVVFMLIAGNVIARGLPAENVAFLAIILALWDPWHFLMQHYGFMRIYDRNNLAPRDIAARMDLGLCASWFIFIMLSTMHWLPDLIYDTYRMHGLPLLHVMNSTVFQLIVGLAGVAVIVATVLYIRYLHWCRRQGYYISPAKIALMTVTFSVMYLTYVPNGMMRRILPEWSFAMGFATLGMVHVTQYLAIVWKYNRRLADRKDRVREGWFVRVFSTGGPFLVLGYLLVCLLYGFLLTPQGQKIYLIPSMQSVQISRQVGQWVLATLAAVNFTSTILHYYYDGFIWKVRHKENRQALDLQQSGEQPATGKASSWWDRSDKQRPVPVLLHQMLYFMAPMLLLTATFWMFRQDPHDGAPLQFLAKAEAKIQNAEKLLEKARGSDGQMAEQDRFVAQQMIFRALREAEKPLEAIDRQLDIERKMIDIRPRAMHYTYVAALIEQRAYFRMVSQLVQENRQEPSPAQWKEYRQAVLESIDNLQKALELPPPYTHREYAGLTEMSEMTSEKVRERIRQLQDLVGGDPVRLSDAQAKSDIARGL